MQSSNLKEIKAALWEQAFLGSTRVSCPMGRVVAIKKRKGQLQAMVFGWGRWHHVENVVIEVRFAFPPQTPSRSTPFHQGQAAPAEATVIGGKG